MLKTIRNLVGTLKIQHSVIIYAMDGLERDSFSEVPDQLKLLAEEVFSHFSNEERFFFPFISKTLRLLNRDLQLYGERKDVTFINSEVISFNAFMLDMRRCFEICEEARSREAFQSAYSQLQRLLKKRLDHEAAVLYPAIIELFE